MKDTFNSDFYITAATIIPVLYLALTLQSSTFDMVLEWWGKLLTRRSGRSRKVERRFWIALLVAIVGLSLLIEGLFGEIYAVQALYSRQSNIGTTQFILVSVIILTLAVIVVTSIRLITTFYNATIGKQQD